MNACEALQIAKLNLRPGRGRSLEHLTQMALRTLRNDRHSSAPHWELWSSALGFFDTVPADMKKARFAQLQASQIHHLPDVRVYDPRTRIQIM